MAKEFSTTPADLLGLEDPYTHFCLNEAAYLWGIHVENEMREASEKLGNKSTKAARERAVTSAMRRLLYGAKMDHDEDEDRPEATPPPGAFRDPRELVNK